MPPLQKKFQLFHFLFWFQPFWCVLLLLFKLSPKPGYKQINSMFYIMNNKSSGEIANLHLHYYSLYSQKQHFFHLLVNRGKLIDFIFIFIDSCGCGSIRSIFVFVSAVHRSLLWMHKKSTCAKKWFIILFLFLFWWGKLILNGNK